MKKHYLLWLIFATAFLSCKKNNSTNIAPPSFLLSFTVNGNNNGTNVYTHLTVNPVIRFSFTAPVQQSGISANFSLLDNSNAAVAFAITVQNNDSVVIITPSNPLKGFSKYSLSVSSSLLSTAKGSLINPVTVNLATGIDSTDKFLQMADTALLTLVQQQTFKYFWDFGHPVCGLARERDNGDNEVVTTGGSGFGIMAMIVAVSRGFIARADAVARLNTMVNFLATKCERWHGAFSHWLNGSTGATVPFGNNNGADIVETSYLMEGLLTARQYFNAAGADETALRDSINSIWNNVEWSWFTQNGTTSNLYWQYNPSYSAATDIWSIPVTGWNEALITYVLSASSTTHPITKSIYDSGWARNGAIKNGNAYYNIVLPLGEPYGGPLFFAHYS
ncbi:MAG: Ig-like domain-containing protein, partial [Bacteroidetes bacterium]|nr:Ig-like domain-containing protein [Bacteroidota bacterium]